MFDRVFDRMFDRVLLCQLHMNQLAATAAAADVLTDLSASLQSRLQQQKDLIGYDTRMVQYRSAPRCTAPHAHTGSRGTAVQV